MREDAKIEITADEKVRFVEGKHLYLKSEEKSYSYELTGKEEFKEKKAVNLSVGYRSGSLRMAKS